MASSYTIEQRIEARRLFVEDGLGATAISRAMGGRPVPQTILNWSQEADKDGKSWEDLRQERVEMLIESASPDQMAKRLMERINKLISDPNLDPKQADALSKYVSTFRQLIDPAYQVSMTYQVMTQLTLFLKTHYPDVITESWVAAMREFKNETRRRLSL